MKNLRILIFGSFFLGSTFWNKAEQSISHSISFSSTIINFQIVLQEFLGLANITRVQVFCIHELAEFIIVCKNKNLEFAVF